MKQSVPDTEVAVTPPDDPPERGDDGTGHTDDHSCAPGHSVSSSSSPRPPHSVTSLPLARLHQQPPPKFFFDGIGFYSLSEAACALSLQRFIPEFSIRVGATFQVPLGCGRSVDFMVQGVLLEYHHVRFCKERRRYGDFKGAGEYRDYQHARKRARRNPYLKKKLLQDTRRKLAENYYEKRRAVINRSSEFRDCELVVATSVEELYLKIIQRFGGEGRPSKAKFVRTFQAYIRLVAKLSNRPGTGKREAA